MTFGTTLALLVGVLVGLPVIAHLLRRGKTEEIEFPPAHFVPAAVVTSDKRSRIEDWALLALRCLTILLLSVLGATPFVKCSHLSVDRADGASVALALVIDDSQSMRAVPPGDVRSRFEQAKSGAMQLLDSAREGDAIAIVGGGVNARLLLNATTDLENARQVLGKLDVSDRSTDLASAVALARAALKELPHADKRVALFSDQHDEAVPSGSPELWVPLPDLAQPVANCGIAEALRAGNEVDVMVGCSDETAAANQRVQLRLDSADGEVVQERVLEPRAQTQHVTFTKVSQELTGTLAVRLVNSDGIERDNSAQVSRETTGLNVGVVADRERTSAATGGAPVIEQALDALDPTLVVKPLSRVPDTADQLGQHAALIVDDPRGFSPETRAALEQWLARGGVLLGLLGPSSMSAELAASSEPFARPGMQWETSTSAQLDVASLGLLGGAATSLTDLRQTGRLRLDAADLPGSLVRGKWSDGVPFIFERTVGLGTVFTVGLPSAFEVSEFVIRPGFLALLDVVCHAARSRSGPKRGFAGIPWTFPSQVDVKLDGDPAVTRLVERVAAAIPNSSPSLLDAANETAPQQQFTPTASGVYQLTVDGRPEQRAVTLDPRELFQKAVLSKDGQQRAGSHTLDNAIDASPYWALFVLALFAAELGYRALRTRLQAS